MSIFPPISFGKRSKAPSDDTYYMANYGSPIPTIAGTAVDEKKAATYVAVYSCVTTIAGDVSRLPLNLYRHRTSGAGKDRVTDHPTYDLLHSAPNNEMTSQIFFETSLGHSLLWGNHYSVPIFDRAGRLTEIWPIDNPGAVSVDRSASGRLIYSWTTASNERVTKTRDEMFHVPSFGFNGLVGQSPITIARESIGLGLAYDEFASRFVGHGTHPAGIVSMPQEAGGMSAKDQTEYLNALKSQVTGLGKSHSMMLLPNGEKYTPLSMPMRDAQFIESREFQKKEIASLFKVPAHKIAVYGQNTNHSNLEQENQSYVDGCLIHWLVRYEQCINQQLLTKKDRLDGYFFEFVIDGLLRGDSQARSEYYTKRFHAGSITPNEIRAFENQNPIPGGDDAYVPLNLIPIGMAKQVIDNQNTDETDENNQDVEQNRSKFIENRSVLVRDRVSKQYLPLIRDAAQTIVNRESKAISQQAEKNLKNRPSSDFKAWLNDFYNGFGEYIRLKIGPTLRSFSDAIYQAAADEVGVDPNDPEIRQQIDEMIKAYADRHISSSLGQMESLSVDGDQEAVKNRADEWHEKRADKIATNETTRFSNAVYQFVAFSIGVGTAWRIRGAKTCPYCKSLSGKRVVTGQSFVGDGDVITVKDGDNYAKMKINGLKRHPPLHRGCDCYLSMG